MNIQYKGLVDALKYIKDSGENKETASDCLEIDSDQELDSEMLDRALDEVFGK